MLVLLRKQVRSESQISVEIQALVLVKREIGARF